MHDILFLAHRVPYPPDRGDKIRSWHILQALAKLAHVHVVALCDDERDKAHLDVLRGVAASVAVFDRSASRAGAMTKALLRGGPASVHAFG
ncbi:MAG: glycosyl transferase family 1, partial [Alphaproteobacteria bacterium]|nr:glycosyl transferase family 1 [Alphaproteobacteria bacterium]